MIDGEKYSIYVMLTYSKEFSLFERVEMQRCKCLKDWYVNKDVNS